MQSKIIKIVSNYLPEYQTPGSSGVDLVAQEHGFVYPHMTALVKTGIKVKIPEGYELQIRPRSGLALKHRVTVLNTPGTIDSDYTQEIMVLLINHNPYNAFEYKVGDRIAQAVLCPIVKIAWESVTTLDDTERSGGFGSTGVVT